MAGQIVAGALGRVVRAALAAEAACQVAWAEQGSVDPVRQFQAEPLAVREQPPAENFPDRSAH